MRKRDRDLVLLALAAIWWEARAARVAAEEARQLALTASDFDPTSWLDWKNKVRDKLINKLIPGK